MSEATANSTENRELVLERIVDAPRERLFDGWTNPKLMPQWFAPAPLVTTVHELDLRPGGAIRITMRDPNSGAEYPASGVYLEIVKNERLVWTNALLPGYRPAASGAASADNLVFTAIIEMRQQGTGTRYTATAIHRNEDEAQKHANMGFHDGWGKALEQLVALAKKL